jgi:intracellular septation protein A
MLERGAPVKVRPMLIASDQEFRSEVEDAKFSKRSVLMVIGRRGLPHLLEATLIPALLFWVVLNVLGATAAMITALVWTFGCLLRRVVQGHRIPGVLILATIGLIVRTIVALLSGSTFIYFMQPIATTVVLAMVFLGSVLIGQPLVARLAADFCPIDAELHRRPGVMQLFSGLTILWAAVHLANAAATYGLLVSLPVATFVALKTGACLAITFGGILLTVSWAIRTARRENLVFAKVSDY